jgi:phosphatidyl-myo-inositol dimannoside synthase
MTLPRPTSASPSRRGAAAGEQSAACRAPAGAAEIAASGEPDTTPVCIVSTTSAMAVGGLATYVRLLSAGLARQRPTTTVARFERDGSRALDPAAAEPRRTLDQGDGVTLTIIAPPRALRPLAWAARRLVHHPRTQRLAVALFVWAYAPALARAVPGDVRVVHWAGSGWELLGFAALRVARRRGAVFTVLSAIHEGSWGDGALDGRLYAAADRVLALSAPESRLLEKLGVQRDRIDVTGLGPGVCHDGDGDAFRARHGLGGRPIVLFVGRKESYKGYHVLCEAIERVRRSIPAAVLVAIGPPAAADERRPAGEALLDLGVTDDREKADALAACDVLCLPSAGESFGIVYVEAWQYGKPVVVGPSPASRDLEQHGVTGLHVDQRADDVEAALLALLRDPAYARGMGARGRALQRERYTWAATLLRHASCFTRAGATPRAARRA